MHFIRTNNIIIFRMHFFDLHKEATEINPPNPDSINLHENLKSKYALFIAKIL